MLGCGWPEAQLSAWSVWSPGAAGWALAGLWEALLGLADAGPASRVLWSGSPACTKNTNRQTLTQYRGYSWHSPARDHLKIIFHL